MNSIWIIAYGLFLVAISFPSLPHLPRPRFSDFAPGLFILGAGLVILGAAELVRTP